MITKRQLTILGIMAKEIFRGYTFNEIMKLSNEKSNSGIQRAIKEFLNEKLLFAKKFGNVNVYYLNIENLKVFDYLGICYKEKSFGKVVNEDLSIILDEISRKDAFAIIIVFGSFVSGKNRTGSDLDVAIIVKKEKNNIKVAINNAEKKCLSEIHAEILDEEEFLKMLNINYENVGKEIARKGLAIYNTPIFYNLIKKGVENGFKI